MRSGIRSWKISLSDVYFRKISLNSLLIIVGAPSLRQFTGLRRKRGPLAAPFFCGSERLEGYTSPWSIIESATLRKPAMFAPFT